MSKPATSAPIGLRKAGPAPPPCALEGPKQPPRWEIVIPPSPQQPMDVEEVTKEESPKNRRLPRIVAIETVVPPRDSTNKEEIGLEEPMETESNNGH